MPDRPRLFHLLILSAAGFALYAYSLGNGFVADDGNEVLKDPLIRSFANIPTMFAHGVWFFMGSTNDRYYRPLKLLTYSLEYRFFGFQPSLWHLVNILFYVATVAVVYFLVRDLASRTLAFWTALFFAFHPIHVEAVAWIAAGNDLLCGLMLLLSLWLYHRACLPRHEDSSGHLRRVGAGAPNPACGRRAAPTALLLYVLSVVAFFAGLLFKETALTFPAIILAYDFFYRGESLRGMLRAWRRYLAYFAVLGGYLALRVHALHGLAPGTSQYHLTPKDMILTVPVLAVRYVGKAFLPINQNFWYGYEPVRRLGWEPIGAVALVFLLVLAMFWLRPVPSGTGLRRPDESGRGREPVLAFALAWFWTFLVPVLDVSKTSWLLADRYLYVSSFGFCVFAAWAWLWLRDRAASLPARSSAGSPAGSLAGLPVSSLAGRAALACLLAIFVFYTVVIARRLPDWHDGFNMLMKTVRQDPNVASIAAMAGTAYVVRGQLQDALPYLERAVALAPDADYTAMAYTNLGMVYFTLGRRDDAIREYQKAVQLVPSYPPFWTNLAIAYRRTNRTGKAIETCQRGLALDPADHELLIELGLAEWQAGEREQAIAAFRRAIATEPGSLDSYVNLASVLVQQSQLDAAIDQLLAGLAASPRAPDAYLAHYQLGVAYQAKGLWPAAAQEYRRALELQPGFAPARAKLEGLESAPAGTQP